tara:strand:- start:822 stop:2003 length:1182 start_codon:yes stop_codon:yes gene_type:complete
MKTPLFAVIIASYIIAEFALNVSMIHVVSTPQYTPDDIETFSIFAKIGSSVGISLMLVSVIINIADGWRVVGLFIVAVIFTYGAISAGITAGVKSLPLELQKQGLAMAVYREEVKADRISDPVLDSPVDIALFPLRAGSTASAAASRFVFSEIVDTNNKAFLKEVDKYWIKYRDFMNLVRGSHQQFKEKSRFFNRPDLPGQQGYWSFKTYTGVKPQPNISLQDFYNDVLFRMRGISDDLKWQLSMFKLFNVGISRMTDGKYISINVKDDMKPFMSKAEFRQFILNLAGKNLSLDEYDKSLMWARSLELKSFFAPVFSIALSAILIMVNFSRLLVVCSGVRSSWSGVFSTIPLAVTIVFVVQQAATKGPAYSNLWFDSLHLLEVWFWKAAMVLI